MPLDISLTTGSCPDGTNPGNCLVNPCQRATCPGVKGARCVADYCGGCNTLWVLNGEAVSHLCGGKYYTNSFLQKDSYI